MKDVTSPSASKTRHLDQPGVNVGVVTQRHRADGGERHGADAVTIGQRRQAGDRHGTVAVLKRQQWSVLYTLFRWGDSTAQR